MKDPITDNIRYVGKTKNSLNERLRGHLKLKTGVDNKHSRWISSLKILGLKPEIEILDICLEEDWQYVETYWISQLRSWSFDLTNQAIGGKGGDTISKHPRRLEVIDNIRKGNKKPNKGGVYNNIEGFKEKQSISNSKKHIELIDINTKEVFTFINSKRAAEFVGVTASQIRNCKVYGYKANRRYIVRDLED